MATTSPLNTLLFPDNAHWSNQDPVAKAPEFTKSHHQEKGHT